VFPAHNEGENIEACCVVSNALLAELVDDYEILVVDDGSTDDTPRLVEALAARYPKVRCIRQPRNAGYGLAIREGFRQARFELLFFSDADRQFDLYNLTELLPLMDAHDLAVGYRARRQDTIMRRILSWGYNVLARALFGFQVRDVDCAFKLFRREAIERIDIQSERWFLNTEILAKATILGLRIAQRPVTHLPRSADVSKVGIGDIPRTLRELMRIRRQINEWERRLRCAVY
jgi:glycosyltransferase involved in cell wall biosynthesis